MSEGAARNRLAKRLGPGVWLDEEGGMHFSVPEILELFGVEDTPENRRMLTRCLEEGIKQRAPESVTVTRTGSRMLQLCDGNGRDYEIKCNA